jgi:hypothetical protein
LIIVYTPAGGEPEHYDARSLKVSEVSIVSRTIDMRWPVIKEGLTEDDLDAMRGIVWVIKKRSQPSLRFGEFDPGVDEMVTRLDKDEVVNYVTEAVAIAAQDPDVTGEQIAHALRQVPDMALDREHAEATIKELTEDPKDSGAQPPLEETSEPSLPESGQESTSSGPNTSDSSLTSSTSHLQPSTS